MGTKHCKLCFKINFKTFGGEFHIPKQGNSLYQRISANVWTILCLGCSPDLNTLNVNLSDHIKVLIYAKHTRKMYYEFLS